MSKYQIIETSIYYVEAENADEAQAKFENMQEPYPSKVWREYEIVEGANK